VEGHKGSVLALALAADGKTLISGSSDNTIKLWSLPDGTPLKTVEGHKGSVLALALAADGKTLISGSSDKTIRLWRLPDGEWISCLMDLGCSPDTAKGKTFTILGAMGRTVTYTLPCGAPTPSGASCTCDCVPGSVPTPVTNTEGRGGGGGFRGGGRCACMAVRCR
jgi:hypothetical protein